MIAGVDASLSAFGIALPAGDLLTLKPKAGAAEPARRLHELARAVERALRLHPPRPELVLIEGYDLHPRGITSAHRLAELGGVIRLRLFELGVPYLEIPPASLKRYATGNGNANKDRMIDAARALGATPADHDQADAFLLRHLGRAAYGLEPTIAPHAAEIVAAFTWPSLGRAA